MELLESGKILSKEDFTKLEGLLGMSLPEDFVSFYLRFNGGTPSLDSVHDENHLFPIHEFDELDQIEMYYTDQDDSVVPSSFDYHRFLPFACDQGGNIYGLYFSNPGVAKVIFYTHEDKEIHGQWDSFSKFIGCFVNDS